MNAARTIGSHSFDWESFWDVATTTKAAQALDALYGEGAARAAIECALAAAADRRSKDEEFWLEGAAKLKPRQLH